jgi:hypothetical protein
VFVYLVPPPNVNGSENSVVPNYVWKLGLSEVRRLCQEFSTEIGRTVRIVFVFVLRVCNWHSHSTCHSLPFNNVKYELTGDILKEPGVLISYSDPLTLKISFDTVSTLLSLWRQTKIIMFCFFPMIAPIIVFVTEWFLKGNFYHIIVSFCARKSHNALTCWSVSCTYKKL